MTPMMVSLTLGELKSLIDLLNNLGLFGGNYDDQVGAIRKLRTAWETTVGTGTSTGSVTADSKPAQRKKSKVRGPYKRKG